MQTLPTLRGSSYPPAAGGPPNALVVLLHGWGADGDDLMGLAAAWSRKLPHARFVTPNGPYPCDQNPMGRQWFSFRDSAPERISAEAAQARAIIDAYLDGELGRLALGEDRLVIAGFSQGAMMALHVALRRPRACAAVVSYSGALIADETLGQEITARPPVFLAHGDADQVVPFESLEAAVAALGAMDVPVRWHAAQGIGHGIDDEGVALGGEFISASLGV